MIDSYEQLFKLIPKDKFFAFGLDNIVSIEAEKATTAWQELKKRIENKNDKLFIRGLGRNGTGNNLMKKMYADVFGISINIDQTNNQKPTIFLEKSTGLQKHKDIKNYQVSHVFGRTKNVYCFTAPWNIVYIPKAIDPFTGHEAKGEYVEDFQNQFKIKIYSQYTHLIEDFNQQMTSAHGQVEQWLKQNDPDNRFKTLLDDFSPIPRMDNIFNGC